jgi:hypothetical protein
MSEWTPVPEILCHPNIPKPLHGVNPRTIFGKEWWDIERHKAYASYAYHCAACGVKKENAKYHKWLEAHEFYLFDYPKGRVTFDHLVPLCHACHNYIHDGRMQMMVQKLEMTQQKYDEIMEHGDDIVKAAKLTKKRRERHKFGKSADWADWRLVVFGIEYGPSTQSMSEWAHGKWRNWKP